MSTPTVITIAKPDQKDQMLHTVVAGFSIDPMMRWIWPTADLYYKFGHRMMNALGGAAFDHGSAYLAGADDLGCKAAALWLPPGVEVDGDAIMAVMADGGLREEIAEDLLAVQADIQTYHPKDPYWYLSLIAADPFYIGQGLGGALMKEALKRCDEEGVQAYLESSNPQNISLYLRHGFEVMGECQIGASPVMTPMIRAPR